MLLITCLENTSHFVWHNALSIFIQIYLIFPLFLIIKLLKYFLFLHSSFHTFQFFDKTKETQTIHRPGHSTTIAFFEIIKNFSLLVNQQNTFQFLKITLAIKNPPCFSYFSVTFLSSPSLYLLMMILSLLTHIFNFLTCIRHPYMIWYIL